MENSLIPEEESTALDWWLCLGVLLIPCVFAWFTLASRYSIKSKVLAFAWLIIVPIGASFIPHPNKQNVSTNPVKKKPAVIWSAQEIMSLYKQNKVRADNTLKGEIINVVGTINTIGKDITDTPYVTLNTDDPIFSVQIFFKGSELSKLAKLNPGDYLRVTGQCGGALGNVVINDAEIY